MNENSCLYVCTKIEKQYAHSQTVWEYAIWVSRCFCYGLILYFLFPFFTFCSFVRANIGWTYTVSKTKGMKVCIYENVKNRQQIKLASFMYAMFDKLLSDGPFFIVMGHCNDRSNEFCALQNWFMKYKIAISIQCKSTFSNEKFSADRWNLINE